MITLSNSNISGKANFATGLGDDTLNLDHDMLGSFDAAMGAGNDHISTDTVTVVGESTLVGGADNDTISLSNFNAGTLSVQGSAGDDTLTASNVFVARKATFDGGDGADTIWLNGFNSTNLLVNGGTGFDHLWLISATASQNITVNGGVGDDTANLNQIRAGSVNVNMGVGNDTVYSQHYVGTGLLSVTLDKGQRHRFGHEPIESPARPRSPAVPAPTPITTAAAIPMARSTKRASRFRTRQSHQTVDLEYGNG